MKVSFLNNPEAPFGLELMAERERRGHLLKCYENFSFITFAENDSVVKVTAKSTDKEIITWNLRLRQTKSHTTSKPL
jgi:hypothetical protein